MLRRFPHPLILLALILILMALLLIALRVVDHYAPALAGRAGGAPDRDGLRADEAPGEGDPEAGVRGSIAEAEALARDRKHDEAVRVYRAALVAWERITPGDDRQAVEWKTGLADSLMRSLRFAEAREEWLAVLAMRRRLGIADDPAVLGAIGNLATAVLPGPECTDAVRLQREVVAMARRLYGELPRPVRAYPGWRPGDHREIVVRLLDLSSVLATDGQHAEALGACREALEMSIRCLSPRGQEARDAQGMLAWRLAENGEGEAAVAAMRKRMEMEPRLVGSRTPEVRRVRDQLPMLLFKLDRRAEAAEELDREVARAMPPSPGDAKAEAIVWADAAEVFQRIGETERSIAAHRASIAALGRLAPADRSLGREKMQGDPVAWQRVRIAEGLLILGRGDEALAEARTALVEVEAVPESARSRFRRTNRRLVGKCLESLGRREEALAEYRAAARALRETCEEDPTCLGRADLVEGESIQAIDPEAAVELFRAAHDRFSAMGPEGASDLGLATVRLARGLCRVNRAEESLPLARRVLAGTIDREGKETLSTIEARLDLADALLAVGRPAEALTEARAALALAERRLGRDDARLGRAVETIGKAERPADSTPGVR